MISKIQNIQGYVEVRSLHHYRYKTTKATKGKTGNVRFYAIQKIEKQSLKTICSLLG